MREIKFRGKRKDKDEWVYGYLFWQNYGLCIQQFEPISPTLSDPSGDNENYEIYPVISDSVTQYTGLKDAKGNEIYEGDIVELVRSTPYSYSKGKKLEIVFNIKELCFSAYPIGFAHQKVMKLQVTANKNEMFKIIGNIYENPELTDDG